ncbi:MAG TPA: AsmA family protein [Acidobacteriaceae bacterium]|nr:AsmA family protein [Acidobacteriaceae bacterium]
MKRWMKILAAGLALAMIAIAAIPFLVDANTFRPMLETKMSTALGRTVKLGNLHFALVSGSLVANNLSIADDPAFSTTPFLSARELRIGVDMKSLIFHRQIHVRGFEIEAPQIHLVQGGNGRWNFSSLSRSAASLTEDSGGGDALFHSAVGLIAIRDGRAVVETLPAQGTLHVYDHLRLTVRQFSLGRQFPFEMGATVPGDGVVSVKGNLGPIDPHNAAKTAFDVQVGIQHLDPVAAGFLDPNAGVSVLADIAAHAASDGNTVRSSGTLAMQRLQLVKTGSPSPQRIELAYNIIHKLDDNTGQLQQAAIRLGAGTIHLSGIYRLIPEDPWVDLKVAGESVPIDELGSLMTAAGVKLPNGSQLKGGTLTMALGVTGPANALVIAGSLELDKTKLVGFDLGSKISGIAALGGVKTGSTTSIQSLKLNFQASNAGIVVDAIDSVIDGMGESTGSGTVSPTGVLSFGLVAHVTNARGMGKVGVGLLTKMHQFGRPDSAKEPAEGVPMLVSGTANNPVITADVTGLMHRNASTLLSKAKSLFGRKSSSATGEK